MMGTVELKSEAPLMGTDARSAGVLVGTLPRLPVALVHRPRLYSLLSEALPVTVLSGPRGYGKTTLITAWLERAIETGEVAPESLMWLDAEAIATDSKSEELTSRVREEISKGGQVLAVIDRFEAIESPTVEAELLELVRTHRNFRLIIAVRHVDQHRKWNAIDLDMMRIDGADLRFTAAETFELLKLLSLRISDEQAADLHQKLGGWPELIRVAGLNGGELSRTVEYFRTQHVLAELDPAFLQFTQRTSVARTFTAPMARYLVDGSESEAIIERLISLGMLEEFEGEQGATWYRYIPVIEEAATQDTSDDDHTAILMRLSRWCSEHDLAEAALQFAIRAKA